MTQSALIIRREKAAFNYVSVPIGFIFFALYANAYQPPTVSTAISIVYIMIYLMTTGFTVPREMGKYLLIPLLLFVIGIAGSADNSYYDVWKDAWYYLNPPITLCAGYLAMKRIKKIEPVLDTFIVGGLLLSLNYLVVLLSNIPFLMNATVNDLHDHIGGGHFLTVLSLACLVIANRRDIVLFNDRFSKKAIHLVIFINAAAVFLSLYRALWISFLILVLFGGGFITLKKLFRGLAVVGTLFAAFQIAILLIPEDQLDPGTMLGKISRSLNEVIIQDYSRVADVHAHWRGYESYMAFQTYSDGSFLNLFAGHGFGKLVDLKIVMLLGTEKFRYIPILHNGYMYLLVKTGFLGLVLHLSYLYMFIRTGTRCVNDADNHLIFTGYFIMSMPIVLLLTTFFTSGMFNKFLFFPLMLLLGCLVSYARIRKAELQGGAGT